MNPDEVAAIQQRVANVARSNKKSQKDANPVSEPASDAEQAKTAWEQRRLAEQKTALDDVTRTEIAIERARLAQESEAASELDAAVQTAPDGGPAYLSPEQRAAQQGLKKSANALRAERQATAQRAATNEMSRNELAAERAARRAESVRESELDAGVDADPGNAGDGQQSAKARTGPLRAWFASFAGRRSRGARTRGTTSRKRSLHAILARRRARGANDNASTATTKSPTTSRGIPLARFLAKMRSKTNTGSAAGARIHTAKPTPTDTSSPRRSAPRAKTLSAYLAENRGTPTPGAKITTAKRKDDNRDEVRPAVAPKTRFRGLKRVGRALRVAGRILLEVATALARLATAGVAQGLSVPIVRATRAATSGEGARRLASQSAKANEVGSAWERRIEGRTKGPRAAREGWANRQSERERARAAAAAKGSERRAERPRKRTREAEEAGMGR